jgi:phage major head subunit gpT-like protein
MDINRKSLDTLFTGFNAQFRTGFESVPDTWTKFCSAIQSSSATSVYPFLEQFGGMREWIGDRQVKNLAGKKIEVVNRDFEDTVSIARNDIEDDQYGTYCY